MHPPAFTTYAIPEHHLQQSRMVGNLQSIHTFEQFALLVLLAHGGIVLEGRDKTFSFAGALPHYLRQVNDFLLVCDGEID